MSQSEHSTVPLRPMPAKRLAAAAVLMVAACVGGYLLTPKWQAVRSASNKAFADPLRDFTNPQTPRRSACAARKIRANPQDTAASEYYLYRNAYDSRAAGISSALRSARR